MTGSITAVEGKFTPFDLTYVEVGPHDGPEPFSYANINRKIQGLQQQGGSTPLYIDPDLDISAAVITLLNRVDETGAGE